MARSVFLLSSKRKETVGEARASPRRRALFLADRAATIDPERCGPGMQTSAPPRWLRDLSFLRGWEADFSAGWSHSLSVETSHPRIKTVGPCITCCRSTFLLSSKRAGVASNLVLESFANLASSDYGNFERHRHVASS